MGSKDAQAVLTYLLEHTLQIVREGLMTCLEVATSGLLAVALRALACGSAVLCSCAYEVLAHYNEMLEASNFRHGSLSSIAV